MMNIVSLTQRVADHLQRTTTRHKVEVCPSRPERVVDIDPGPTEQILVNVIGNAIKYSPQGGPVMIKLWEEVGTGMVHISVQDRGIGIPKHQQGQIFGRFIRADNAHAWDITGTGLGLYLSRALVEQHGGKLWFESQEGAGFTFFLTFLLATNFVQTWKGGEDLLADQANAVFSEPVVCGNYTVITASGVNAGGGFGSRMGIGPTGKQTGEASQAQEANGGGGGAGGASRGRPVAAIVIGPDGFTVQPLMDMTKVALSGIAFAVSIVALLRKVLK